LLRAAPNARAGLCGGLAAAASAAWLAVWMWPFAIDDAWIGVRYARHLAHGEGYRFNAAGAVTDGVTPLPWAFLLVPLAAVGTPDAADVLERAKYMGLLVWVIAAAALGVAMARADASPWTKASAIAVLALDLPLAAHAVSGMETALATALATFAALAFASTPSRGSGGRTAALLAGLAASLRPEMAPWALGIGVAAAWAAETPPARHRVRSLVLGGATALLPFAACALVRMIVFGRPAPLALLAKPSDPSHGLVYVAAASIAALSPILVVSPIALWRAPFVARALVVLGVVHLAAVALAGGDWMPYARLVVPIVPSLLLAFVIASRHAHPLATATRVALALVVGVRLLATAAPNGRTAGVNRAALVDRARGPLAGARSLATLDVGWPTAVTEATLVDLAGITDPEIASLPGGHTSKRVDAALLLGRDPDLLLLYVEGGVDAAQLELDRKTADREGAWRDARFSRAVEGRLAASDVVARHFTAETFLPLGSRGAGYLVLRRRER
jgi:hypothetical protein